MKNSFLGKYKAKMRGGGKAHARPSAVNIFFAWVGSFLGIAICGWLTTRYFNRWDSTLLIGSFGATAVLVYAAVHAPLAQPVNCLGGHVVSAVVGVFFYQHVGLLWLSAALAVSVAIVAMLLTKTLHPPGGATALIAVIGSSQIHNLGYSYALIPVGLGVVILLAVAVITVNLSPDDNWKYPANWF